MSALVVLFAFFVGESYRTEVIFLGDVSAERAITLHERVIGAAGESTIVRGRQPNMIVVKDTPERLKRFRRLLDLLDHAGSAEVRVYVRPVQHVLPSELAARARDLFESPSGEAPAMVPDDRSQQLVVMCRPDTYRALDRLFRKLDVAASGKRRDIRVTPAPSDSNGEFLP